MFLEDLVDETLDEFLLECVGCKVEEVSQLPAILDGIYYLADKEELIADTVECEMLEVGDSMVEHCYKEDGKIYVMYSLDFILQTFTDCEVVWRIQGTVKAQLSMPDENTVNWMEFDDSEDSFYELYEKYKKFVHFDKIEYVFVEADTI